MSITTLIATGPSINCGLKVRFTSDGFYVKYENLNNAFKQMHMFTSIKNDVLMLWIGTHGSEEQTEQEFNKSVFETAQIFHDQDFEQPVADNERFYRCLTSSIQCISKVSLAGNIDVQLMPDNEYVAERLHIRLCDQASLRLSGASIQYLKVNVHGHSALCDIRSSFILQAEVEAHEKHRNPDGSYAMVKLSQVEDAFQLRYNDTAFLDLSVATTQTCKNDIQNIDKVAINYTAKEGDPPYLRSTPSGSGVSNIKCTIITEKETGEEQLQEPLPEEYDQDYEPPNDAKATVPPSFTCLVCTDAAKNTVIQPCRHMVACSACARQLTSCPVCRGPIRSLEKVFI
jgi:hypothetical protein